MPDRSQPPGDGPDRIVDPGRPDRPFDPGDDHAELDGLARVDRLTRDLVRLSGELAAVGEAIDNPAIERNARRIHESARVLAQNVPRERLEDREDPS